MRRSLTEGDPRKSPHVALGLKAELSLKSKRGGGCIRARINEQKKRPISSCSEEKREKAVDHRKP